MNTVEWTNEDLLCERVFLNGRHMEVSEAAYGMMEDAGCWVLRHIAADSTDLTLVSADTSICLCVLGIAVKDNKFIFKIILAIIKSVIT